MTYGPKIKAARKALGLTQVELGSEFGVSEQAVSQWEREETRPDPAKIVRLSKRLKIPIDDFMNGVGGDIAGTPEPAETVEVAGEEYAAIPVYDIKAAAGAGGDGEDVPEQKLLFRMNWLQKITQAPVERLGVVEVAGDSMEPTLRPGDHALVDLSQRNPRAQDGLYVLRRDGGLQVKRVTAHPVDSTLTIGSDNPAYQSFNDVAPKDILIIGRVVWLGRQVV